MCATEKSVNAKGRHDDKNKRMRIFLLLFLSMRKNISRKFRCKSGGNLETCSKKKSLRGKRVVKVSMKNS